MATDWTSIWERRCTDDNGPTCCKRKLRLRGLGAQDWDPTVWRWAWPLQSREEVGLLSRWIQRDPSGLAGDTRTHHCAQGGPSANKGRARCWCVITGGWYQGWEALRSQKTLFMASYSYLFFGVPKSLQMVIAAMKLKDAYSLEGKLWPTYTTY